MTPASRFLTSTMLAIACLTGGAVAQTGGGYDLQWHDFDGKAATVSGGGFTLTGITGQSDARTITGGSYQADGGLVPGLCTGTIGTYGAGCPGAGGFVPEFDIDGCAVFGEQIVFRLDKGVGGGQAFIFLGLGQGSVPMGAGCFLLTVPLLPAIIGPIPLGGAGPGNGAVSFQVPVGNVPPLVTVTLQAFIPDPTTPVGFANSNGVFVTHG